ncbi:hypothetical protein A9Q88_06400 [Gammaproteobacteria bacterium 50_400_T64]|nr:hypothetical protein A9Q88_06400 [Gammaproteobacteria bacterium 50_400_T64]
MPLSVQVAASASPGAKLLAGGSSSSSTGDSERGNRAFSSHFDAEKRSESSQASERRNDRATRQDESAGKPAAAGSATDTSKPVEGREKPVANAAEEGGARGGNKKEAQASPQNATRQDVLADNKGIQNAPAEGLLEPRIDVPFATLGEGVRALLAADEDVDNEVSVVIAASGNASPPEDMLLPQQATGESLDEKDVGLVAQSEVRAAEVQPLATEVSAASVAAALRQGDELNTDDPEAAGSTLLNATDASKVLSRPALTPLPSSELLRDLVSKQTLVSTGITETEAAGVERDVDFALIPGKAIKPALDGAAPVVAEAVANAPGSRENFEQVRQNIMAALAGKPELAGPALVASSVADGGESASQGLNFSNVSSALATPSAESAKYSATQETAPQRFFTLQTPAGQPGWDVEVGNRIRWMVGQNNPGVELRLNPPELGSIEVKVATEGERTSVTLFAANPAAREALEAALPRLREMFADSGMQLASADVSDQNLQQQREQLADSGSQVSDSDSGEAMILETEAGLVQGGRSEGQGVIDYYI